MKIQKILLGVFFIGGICFSNVLYAQNSTSDDEYVVRKKNSTRVNGCGPDGSSKTTVAALNTILGEKNCTPHDKKYGIKDYPKVNADNEGTTAILVDKGPVRAVAFKVAMSTESSQEAYNNAQNRANYEEKSTKAEYNNAGYQKKQCIDEKNNYVRKKSEIEKITGIEHSEY